jgi:trehalose/maltose hydrolase-like predicted phosphorylase
VFWDTDVYVLPFFAATHPPAARAMLEYRIRRLPDARTAAAQLGRAGARFPWESAVHGFDVTPSHAHLPTGEIARIRTGESEEHITADVAWAAACYLDWTGDEAFAAGAGRELLLETARYWASRITVDNSGFAHILQVIGPDEYHHDPVDDNAFTNVMVRWNLRTAASWAEEANAASANEIAEWRRLADRLVDNYDPATHLYEQFTGFHALEPIIVRDVAPRRPITADLLFGYERVKGTQVVKQADVLMLHQLLPDEVASGSLAANYDYYEPRTAHGSSLSPAIHASLAARLGRLDEAVKILSMSARLDLDDVTGTTAGGLHIATMGGVWQALAFGFAGIRPNRDRLLIAPRLPSQWQVLEIPICFRGTRACVRINRDGAFVDAEGKLAWEERAWSE